MSCHLTNQIWTSGLISDITCFNMTGLQTIQTKSDACPFDIAVDSDVGVLYSDLPLRSVYKVKNGRKQTLIVVKPWCTVNRGSV